jgi:hypothetical protein
MRWELTSDNLGIWWKWFINKKTKNEKLCAHYLLYFMKVHGWDANSYHVVTCYLRYQLLILKSDGLNNTQIKSTINNLRR